MQIQAIPPFAISKDGEGAQHAIKDSIQITVLPDVDAKITHRYGANPHKQKESRWLHIDCGELHIFINGTHVLVSSKDHLPTFDIETPEELVNQAMKYFKIHKAERGNYVFDCDHNRTVLKSLIEQIQVQERNKLLSWMKHLWSKLL